MSSTEAPRPAAERQGQTLAAAILVIAAIATACGVGFVAGQWGRMYPIYPSMMGYPGWHMTWGHDGYGRPCSPAPYPTPGR